jgi:predicted transcriptional regulator
MPTSSTSLKLDEEMSERIQQLGAARRRTPKWILREAVEQYVEREEKRECLLRDANAAWAHYQATGLHVTAAEAQNWLAELESVGTPMPLNATFEVVAICLA